MTILDRVHLTGPSASPVAIRLKSILVTFGALADAFVEAREMEREAHRRHAFVDWS